MSASPIALLLFAFRHQNLLGEQGCEGSAMGVITKSRARTATKDESLREGARHARRGVIYPK